MKHLFVLISVLVIGNSLLFAQENNTRQLIDEDKKNYEENVFNKEFGELDEDSIAAQRRLYDRIPEKLPDWVFNPVDFGNPIRVVGLSDFKLIVFCVYLINLSSIILSCFKIIIRIYQT